MICLNKLAVGSSAAGRLDDVEARFPARDELRNELGRMLHVGVEADHRVALGVVHARGQRGLMAEVARQMDHRDAIGMLGVQGVERGAGAVGAAVIDQQHRVAYGRPVHHLEERVDEVGDPLDLVVDRRDHGQGGGWRAHRGRVPLADASRGLTPECP